MISTRLNPSFSLDNKSLTINYEDDLPRLHFLGDKKSTPRVYLMCKYNPSQPLIYNLAQICDQSANDKNAIFIINFSLPANSQLTLPKHLKCYIIEQDMSTIKVIGDYSVVKLTGKNEYVSIPTLQQTRAVSAANSDAKSSTPSLAEMYGTNTAAAAHAKRKLPAPTEVGFVVRKELKAEKNSAHQSNQQIKSSETAAGANDIANAESQPVQSSAATASSQDFTSTLKTSVSTSLAPKIKNPVPANSKIDIPNPIVRATSLPTEPPNPALNFLRNAQKTKAAAAAASSSVLAAAGKSTLPASTSLTKRDSTASAASAGAVANTIASSPRPASIVTRKIKLLSSTSLAMPDSSASSSSSAAAAAITSSPRPALIAAGKTKFLPPVPLANRDSSASSSRSAAAPAQDYIENVGKNRDERRKIATARLKKYLENQTNPEYKNDEKFALGRPLRAHQIKILNQILIAQEKSLAADTKIKAANTQLQTAKEKVLIAEKNLTAAQQGLSAAAMDITEAPAAAIDAKPSVVKLAEETLNAALAEKKLAVIAKNTAENEKQFFNYVVPLITGGGKTCLFLRLAKITGLKTLILVPTDELIDQTVKGCSVDAAGAKIGKLFSHQLESKETQSDGFPRIIEENNIIVTSYQTLQRHYQKINFDQIDTIVNDEGHQSKSDLRKDMVNHFIDKGCAVSLYSATPGDALDDESCYSLLGYKIDGSDNPITGIRSIKEAIEAGINCPVVTGIYTIDDEKDHYYAAMDICLNKKAPNGQPFREMQGVFFGDKIEEIKLLESKFNAISLDEYDPKGVLRTRYATNKQQAAQLSNTRFTQTDYDNAYNNFKIAAAVYSGQPGKEGLNKHARKAIIEKARLGGVANLLTVNALLEGFDLPTASFAVMMKKYPSKRRTLVQAAGRVLRLNPLNKDKVAVFMQLKIDNPKKKPYFFLTELSELNNVFSCGVAPTYYSAAASAELKMIEVAKTPDYKIQWASTGNTTIKIMPEAKTKTPKPVAAKKTERKKSSPVPVDVNTAYDKLKDRLTLVRDLFDKFRDTINIEKVIPETTDSTENDSYHKSDKDEKTIQSLAKSKSIGMNDDNDDEKALSTFGKEAKEILKEIREELTAEAIETAPSAAASSSSAAAAAHAPTPPSQQVIRLANKCSALYKKINALLLQASMEENPIRENLQNALDQLKDSVNETSAQFGGAPILIEAANPPSAESEDDDDANNETSDEENKAIPEKATNPNFSDDSDAEENTVTGIRKNKKVIDHLKNDFPEIKYDPTKKEYAFILNQEFNWTASPTDYKKIDKHFRELIKKTVALKISAKNANKSRHAELISTIPGRLVGILNCPLVANKGKYIQRNKKRAGFSGNAQPKKPYFPVSNTPLFGIYRVIILDTQQGSEILYAKDIAKMWNDARLLALGEQTTVPVVQTALNNVAADLKVNEGADTRPVRRLDENLKCIFLKPSFDHLSGDFLTASLDPKYNWICPADFNFTACLYATNKSYMIPFEIEHVFSSGKILSKRNRHTLNPLYYHYDSKMVRAKNLPERLTKKFMFQSISKVQLSNFGNSSMVINAEHMNAIQYLWKDSYFPYQSIIYSKNSVPGNMAIGLSYLDKLLITVNNSRANQPTHTSVTNSAAGAHLAVVASGAQALDRKSHPTALTTSNAAAALPASYQYQLNQIDPFEHLDSKDLASESIPHESSSSAAAAATTSLFQNNNIDPTSNSDLSDVLDGLGLFSSSSSAAAAATNSSASSSTSAAFMEKDDLYSSDLASNSHFSTLNSGSGAMFTPNYSPVGAANSSAFTMNDEDLKKRFKL